MMMCSGLINMYLSTVTAENRYSYIVCREKQFENVVVFSASFDHPYFSEVRISCECTAHVHNLYIYCSDFLTHDPLLYLL